METSHLPLTISPVQTFHHYPYPDSGMGSFQPSPPAMATIPPAPAVAPSQTQTQADSTDRARAYKSRNKRPCDFCRYKKAACHLDSAPPCELCIRYNKECTFIESPAKRRRPNDNHDGHDHPHKTNGHYERSSNGSAHSSAGNPFLSNGGMNHMSGHDLLGWEHGMGGFSMHDLGMSAGMPPADFGPFDPALYQDASLTFDAFEPISATATAVDSARKSSSHHKQSSVGTSPGSQAARLPQDLYLPFDLTSGEPSLDNQEQSSAQFIGMSGESDPYLLSRYRYDQYNEATFQSIRMRKMNEGPVDDSNNVPAFFMIAHNALAGSAQPPEKMDVLDTYRREIENMVPNKVGKRLIRLFYKYIQPYCPLVTRAARHRQAADGSFEPSGVPTCILAAMYGHALPFSAWDEVLCVEVYTPPSADALFRLAWMACQPLLHTPNLNLLQTLILLVQRRPTNKHVSDTPFKWSIMTTAVSIAQSLGLNMDPSDWPLPDWEIALRRCLGWAIFVQDKWLALTNGRSSHIQADDWDLAPLTDADFAHADVLIPDQPTGFPSAHFRKLCELTVIVDDISHDLFSLRASRALHTNLEATLEVAKPLRMRLTEWYQSLPAGLLPHHPHPTSSPITAPNRPPHQHELDGNGSLQLAYIAAKIALFRAMLRPRPADQNSPAMTALRTGALACAKEVFEFLENLNARELEAFWASYSRSNFVIASNFMLLLFATSPNAADAKECLSLLQNWRSLLRIKSRSCDLLNLALLRLDGVYVAGMETLIDLSPAAKGAWSEGGQKK